MTSVLVAHPHWSRPRLAYAPKAPVYPPPVGEWGGVNAWEPAGATRGACEYANQAFCRVGVPRQTPEGMLEVANSVLLGFLLLWMIEIAVRSSPSALG